MQNEIQKYRRGAADIRPRRHPHANDFFRLARRICGRSIGLVLGGGGARGLAHLVSGLADVSGRKNLTIWKGAHTSIGGIRYSD